MIKGIKTYCFHCGKDLKEDFRRGNTSANIHKECFAERKKIQYHLRKERWKKIMEDPEIRKKIRKIDEQIIDKIKRRFKNKK